MPTTCRVKDIPSSVRIVEEVENAPDLLTFVREILESQAEVLKNVANPKFIFCMPTQEEQVEEEVKDNQER